MHMWFHIGVLRGCIYVYWGAASMYWGATALIFVNSHSNQYISISLKKNYGSVIHWWGKPFLSIYTQTCLTCLLERKRQRKGRDGVRGGWWKRSLEDVLVLAWYCVLDAEERERDSHADSTHVWMSEPTCSFILLGGRRSGGHGTTYLIYF